MKTPTKIQIRRAVNLVSLALTRVPKVGIINNINDECLLIHLYPAFQDLRKIFVVQIIVVATWQITNKRGKIINLGRELSSALYVDFPNCIILVDASTDKMYYSELVGTSYHMSLVKKTTFATLVKKAKSFYTPKKIPKKFK
jgi:hypothetical protein